MDRSLTLEAGPLCMVLAPGRGGAVAALRFDGVDLFRPGPPDGDGLPTDLGCFPMVPLCNRVPGNVLRIGTRHWSVRPNMPGQPLHLHGTGWTSRWTVVQAARDEALLRHEGTEAPWRFTAEQRLTLTPDEIAIELSVVNRAEEAMPFGIGLHPHFPATPGLTMRFAARRFWLMDGDKLPSEPIAVPPELDHRDPRAAPARFRNHVYEGWDGVAEIAWPEHGLALAMRAEPVFAHLLLFRPPAQPVVALEPMSHVPGQDGFGWRLLAPGERMAGRVVFHPRRLTASASRH